MKWNEMKWNEINITMHALSMCNGENNDPNNKAFYSKITQHNGAKYYRY
jgi:hypothetical protein